MPGNDTRGGPSLRAKGHDRIHARRAPRRDVARDERHGLEERGHADKRRGGTAVFNTTLIDCTGHWRYGMYNCGGSASSSAASFTSPTMPMTSPPARGVPFPRPQPSVIPEPDTVPGVFL